MYLDEQHRIVSGMTIKAKFFATLRESLNIDQADVAADQAHDVTDVWRLATNGADMPDHVLCSVNLEHMPADTLVKDGDEVAFFPPVTGG